MNHIDMASNLIRDSYGNCALARQQSLKGYFLEKKNMVKNGYIYKVNKKHFTIFFKESVLYLFVQFYKIPKEFLLKIKDFVDVLMYAQRTGITTAL